MAVTLPEATDVILRDGSTLRLRAPLAEDADALLEFFSALSDQSRYLRFHGFAAVGPKLVEPVLEPDWQERGSLLGSLDGRVVALANWVRLRDPRAAEIAFTVADGYQRRGIGTRLLERLAQSAAAAGIEEFVAEVLAENDAMLGVFRDAGFAVTRASEHGEVEIRFGIAPTSGYREQVAARDHAAVRASLDPFFRPSSLAVVGASSRRGSIGGELFRNVVAADFTGSAYPVNKRGEPVAGVHGYSSVAEIPEAVDLAVVCVPGEHVLGAAKEALAAGVRALVVISAGFAETGSAGAERQEQLLALVREHGARMLGPNCLGIASSPVRLNATFAPRSFPVGKIGFSSQSGALGLALLERAEATGLGVTSFVSIGNKADLSSNDLLEWWEEDDATEMVVLYLESFGNPRAFARIARRLARRKPILALKGGTTSAGSRAAGSHTAALAGSEAAVDALFGQAGVIRARTLDELIDVATLLSAQPVPRGRRVALLTNAGGLGILAADACEAAGLELPPPGEETQAALAALMPAEGSMANPVDLLGGATADSFGQTLPVLLRDPAFDAAIVLFVPTVGTDEEEVGAAISRAAATAEGKPVLCAFLSAKGPPESLRSVATVPAFGYPEAAARALGRAAERGEWLREPAGASAKRSQRAATAGSIPSGRDGCSTPTASRSCRSGSWPPGRPQWKRRASSASRSCSRRPRPGCTRRSRAASPSTSPTRQPCWRLPSESAYRCSSSRSSAAAPSCSRARCRIRSSARSSRSAPEASSPSSSGRPGSGWRRSPTPTPRSSSAPARPAGWSPASAAPRPRTRRRSSTCWSASRCSPTICRSSRSSTSTRCSHYRTAASPSTPG
jgi:acetyl coenzyme A synthetase (ADP forming)-like protein